MRYFGTQYCDKKKRRYCNEKIFLSHGIQYPTKVSSEKNVTYLELRAYHGQKKPLSQNYHFMAILCAKMSRVNKAQFLETRITIHIKFIFLLKCCLCYLYGLDTNYDLFCCVVNENVIIKS